MQLKDLEMAQNSRKLLASGKSPDQLISREEKLALQKEISEQEVLLNGYQKVRGSKNDENDKNDK